MQLWPPQADPSTLTRQVWDPATAASIPGVSKALQTYAGSISQMALDAYRGPTKLPRPPILEFLDLQLRARAVCLTNWSNDYWLHGNALGLITGRYAATGQAASLKYFPAHQWNAAGPDATPDGGVDYYLNGRLVNRHDVIHIQRGSHPVEWWRGVGVVEQHLEQLDGIGLQGAAERRNLKGGGVPSVAVIMPQKDANQTELDALGAKWDEKFAGPGRRPAFLPNGTIVTPLSWNPEEGQMVEARKQSLVDTADMFNLDPYWVGHEGSSHNYKSPGPMFHTLLKVSLEPVLAVFEQTLSLALLPYGQDTRFDRLQLTRDDFATMVTTLLAAMGGKPLLTQEEGRVYAGLSPEPELGEFPEPPPALAPPAAGDDAPKLAAVPDPEDESEDESA